MKKLLALLLLVTSCDRVEEAYDQALERQMGRIENRVMQDAWGNLLSALTSGDMTKVCVYAGVFTASVIQSKGSPRSAAAFEKWACTAAGMPSKGAFTYGVGEACAEGTAAGVCMIASECDTKAKTLVEEDGDIPMLRLASGLCRGSGRVQCCLLNLK